MLAGLTNIKTEIIEIGKRLYDKGFVPGPSGNISIRTQNQILITSSGSCLGELTEKDVISIDIEGNYNNPDIKPSSERFMHVEIYKRRPDINCIIHAHTVKATTISVMGKDLKAPLIAEGVVSIGEIPLVEYDTPSTHGLAQKVAEAFVDHDAALMANHGVTVCGKDLKHTFYKLETIEFLSEIFLTTEMLGQRNEIPAEKLPELLSLREKFKA